MDYILDSGLPLLLKASAVGTLEYSFKNADSADKTEVFLRRGPEGVGLYSTGSAPRIDECPMAAWVVGECSASVCHYCFDAVKSKGPLARGKQRADCPGITFCSELCLAACKPLLDDAGAFLSTFGSSSAINGDRATITIQKLALVILCRAKNSAYARTALLDMIAHGHTKSPTPPHVVAAATELASSLPEGLSDIAATISLERLLNILAFNTHSIPFIGLPSTLLVVFLPTLSLLNHSCRPNSILTRSVSDDRNTLRVSLHTLRKLQPGEQICVSYLATLAGSKAERYALLSTMFETCFCPRCSEDTNKMERQAQENHRKSLLALHKALNSKDNLSIFRESCKIMTCLAAVGIGVSALPEIDMLLNAGAISPLKGDQSLAHQDVKEGLLFMRHAADALTKFWRGDACFAHLAGKFKAIIEELESYNAMKFTNY